MAVATERMLSLVDAVGEAMRQAMEADPTRDRDGRGRRRRRRPRRRQGEHDGRLVRRHEEPLSRSSARTASATRRSPRRASSAPASEPRRPVCGRSSTRCGPTSPGLAFDQIYNQAGKMSYMFGGQARLPLTIRVAMGSGLSAAAQHSGHALRDLHAPARDQGGRAVDAVRREGPAARVDLRRQPGHVLRAPEALRREGAGAGGAVPDPARRRRGAACRQRRHRRRDRGDGRPRARGGGASSRPRARASR